MRRGSWLVAAVAAVSCLATSAGAVAAPVTFDFEDAIPVITQTPFSNTQGGITADFSDPDPAAGQAFFVVPSFLVSLTGNILYDTTGSSLPLSIVFDTFLKSISFDFALAPDAPLGSVTLTAFAGGTLVGSTSATGTASLGFPFPEGTLTFVSPSIAFDRVEITAQQDSSLAVDNIVVDTEAPAVPEPASLALLGVGGLGLLGGWCRRRRDAVAAA